MKRLVFAFIFAVGCSYASPGCTDANGTGKLNYGIVGAPLTVGASAITGCLSDNSANTGSLFAVATTPPPGYATDGLTVNWSVSEPTSGTYLYSYVFTSSPAAEVSHVILGLGSSCTKATTGAQTTPPDCIYNVTTANVTSIAVMDGTVASGTPGTPAGSTISGAGSGGGNPSLPITVGSQAINFQPTPSLDTTSFTISFDSTEAPVLQDVYVRDGSDEAYNIGASNPTTGGIGATMTSASGLFLAAPGTQIGPTTPEPGFYGLLALGMAGLFVVRRKRSLRA